MLRKGPRVGPGAKKTRAQLNFAFSYRWAWSVPLSSGASWSSFHEALHEAMWSASKWNCFICMNTMPCSWSISCSCDMKHHCFVKHREARVIWSTSGVFTYRPFKPIWELKQNENGKKWHSHWMQNENQRLFYTEDFFFLLKICAKSSVGHYKSHFCVLTKKLRNREKKFS